MKPIPYGRQDISDADIQAVVNVLKSDFLTQGPVGPQFEKAIAEYCGASYAVAVSNATAALHLACLALNVKSGDRVWTSPNTFVASANCALYAGAKIDFVDIDPRTYNLDPTALRDKLVRAEKSGELPKVVICVHHSGQSCDMRQIKELSVQYGFKIVEDASHSIGGGYQQRKIGSCQYSDLTVFSFHPVKIITTGEGGCVTTNDETLATRLSLLRSHGITRNEKLMTHKTEGPWYYQQIDLGWNYRMTDIQAALGLSQLSRLDSFIDRRGEIAKYYNQKLEGLPLKVPFQAAGTQSAYHLYVPRIEMGRIKKTKKELFEALHERGVMVNLHYIPVHLQPYYEKLGFKKGMFPEAEKFYEEAMSIPISSGLKLEDQDRVIAALKEVLT